MAIVLIRKMGCPRSSNPYGITDPKGNPACLRERVERLPMRAKYTKVRARSANEGSGTAGWLLAAPVPACFLKDEEDIAAPPGSLNTCISGCTWVRIRPCALRSDLSSKSPSPTGYDRHCSFFLQYLSRSFVYKGKWTRR